MNAMRLREILSAHKTSDEDCVRALIESSRDSSEKAIEDAFAVALRTGTLDSDRGKRLLGIVGKLASEEGAAKAYLETTPELLRLKEEIALFVKQRHELESDNKETADLQLQIHRINNELQAHIFEADLLDADIAKMNQQMDRLKIIIQEVQQ